MRTPSSLRPPFWLLAVACAVVLAACGSDSGSTSSQGDDTTAQPSDNGLQVLVKPERANPGDTVKAEVVNGSDEEFTYGLSYELEFQSGENFEPVKLPPRPVPQIALIAKPGENGPPVPVKLPKDLQPGQYRVVIQRDVPDVGDLSGEFEVNGEY